MKSSSFSADNLLTTLKTLSASNQYYIAYSGGLDSHVLLHAIHSVRSDLDADIYALHVNHGLNKEAHKWAKHCELICKHFDIDLVQLKIEETCPKGESLEAWARNKRYALIATKVANGGVLLTAHHRDDQAETLLLQMMRGAGITGLAAMPSLINRDGMTHLRPLLNVSRKQLQDYAETHRLSWIQDSSNEDLGFDRNYYRHEILPRLQQRWPNVTETLSRAAKHQAEAMMLLEEFADLDLDACKGLSNDRLNLEQVLRLSSARQSNLIRHWLRQLALPVPSTRLMQEIVNKLIPAKIDAEPLVKWSGTEIRRFQQELYALKPLTVIDSLMNKNWLMSSPCQLDNGVLSAKLAPGFGIRPEICPEDCIQIRYRSGGEKIQVSNKEHRQDLKKLFQEASIPPWIRDRIPLLYLNDKLIAVAGAWVDASACSKNDEVSWQVSWDGMDGYMGEEKIF